MYLALNPDDFTLGLAVGVLGLVLLLSLTMALTYVDGSLFFLAAYLLGIVALLLVGEQLQQRQMLFERIALVLGPALMAGLQMRLLRSRHSRGFSSAAGRLVVLASLGLLGLHLLSDFSTDFAASVNGLVSVFSLAWFACLLGTAVFLLFKSRDMAGPWKWWLLLGHLSGLMVALLFLSNLANTGQTMRSYWPVVLMLLLQLPPVYLSLVWRGRMLNELKLRSATADVADPLTGLATTPVLIERLMRILSRAHQTRPGHSSSALFLVEVQNWNGLLRELGSEFGEKLLLEAALRLRRSIGDNDLVARTSAGPFAVVAQGLQSPAEVTALATRLVVSGLRIDSPLLPGRELKFRVIVTELNQYAPLALPAAQAWLDRLCQRFKTWPTSHRLRSILVVDDADNPEHFEVDSSY